MVKLTSFLSLCFLLSACSMYRSEGRKQFESKAPYAPSAQTQGAVTLQGCRNQSLAETWFREEFPALNQELIELHPEYEVWKSQREDGVIEVNVVSKDDAGNTQNCLYTFENHDAWKASKPHFLSELSNSLVNLD